MAKIYLSLCMVLVVIGLIIYVVYKSQEIKRKYRAHVLEGLSRTLSFKKHMLTENDIKHLPEPVQKYLEYTGVIGKEKIYNARMAFEGEMKMGPKQDWIRIETEQYNFFDQPTRLFHIQGVMKGILADGLDSYINGRGSMLVKLAGLLTVANARGKEMDKSAAVTLFNDMCFWAPARLIDKRIKWEVIDPFTVKASFEAEGCKVSAILYFNAEWQLINFTTDDRYMTINDNTYKRVRWSTPVQNYDNIGGLNLATYGEGIWHLPEGDYCYAKITKVKEVEYNCRRFK